MAKAKTQWGDESIRVTLKSPDPIRDEPENQRVMEACAEKFDEVRLRINVGAYGPGTVEKPISRYWWMSGESATVVCRNPDVANWFRAELTAWLESLNLITLEETVDHSD